MTTDIVQLSQLMAEEAGIFRDMLAALEVEKEAALTADLDSLVDSRLAKETCVDKLKSAAGRKDRLVGQMAAAFTLPAGASTLEALLAGMADGPRGTLRALKAEITSLARTADAKNRENAVYLEQGLKMSRSSLALVETICNPQTEYKKSGLVKPGRPAGRLLSRKY
jgi:hypothetical protein